jgi:arginine/ornithine transport system permease protein
MLLQFDIIWIELPNYFTGLWTTLKLVSVSLLLGILFALPLSILRVSKAKLLWMPVWFFTYLIRGTPMLVQLYLVYYGLSQFEFVKSSFLWHNFLEDAFVCACIAMGFNSCAYTTEIISGAIRNTSVGEIEAAKSVGMDKFTMFRRILLPSALRRSIPGYGNEVVFVLQGSSVAGLVTLFDITAAGQKLTSDHYLPFEGYITAGVFYMVLVFLVVAVFKYFEHRWLAFMRPRES